MNYNHKNDLTAALCLNFSGPVLYYFVWWILREANNRGIKTLYFLARDGYLLYEMAKVFCKQFTLPIECKYLYCSRASLRMPSYHLIGDEAYQLLTLGGYYTSLKTLLKRADLNKQERDSVYAELGLQDFNENEPLTRQRFEKVSQLLRQSNIFHTLVIEKSKAAYETAIGYFSQEDLLSQNELAIVDSGWTGSMQRSLRQLLCANGFQGHITGFYFGMYAPPKDPADGTYLTWYFNAKGKTRYKLPFCNNLFECLLSAPHGMTTGYKYEDGLYRPIMAENHNKGQLTFIQKNISTILNYTKNMLLSTEFDSFSEVTYRKNTYQLIKRYMAYPTPQEADVFGQFLFCDDITEAYHLKLADPSQRNILKGYSIPLRVARRILKKSSSKVSPELLWPYGTIAFLPAWKQTWYRVNIYLWEWLRYEFR